MDRPGIEAVYTTIQENFTRALVDIDGSDFIDERWARPGGGGGLTRTISDGPVIERAAINTSAVWGEAPIGLSESWVGAATQFFATGVSIIVHPRSPHAPTFHANLRYFETDGGDTWFGGGADLTPFYLYEEDIGHFHRVLRDVCLRHPVAEYDAWRDACDSYFFLPHRGERRGVGGLFFDHLTDRLDEVVAFQRDLGIDLVAAYLPIVDRRRSTEVSEEQQRWHELRRGRYVEFNLVWDRGTRFGLETGGRTASILASLPPRARWDEHFVPDPATPEGQLMAELTGRPTDWLNRNCP